MKKSRYDALVASLSGVMRGVFDAVPVQERWSIQAISDELRRQSKTAIDRRVLQGCLDSLVDVGLVREGPDGHFIRVVARESDADDTEQVIDGGEAAAEQTSIGKVIREAEPFHVVEEPSTQERETDYEFYLSLRYERLMRAVTILAENADEEVGLALLEIVDEMDDIFTRVHEYQIDVASPTQRRMVMNPGWYHHVVGDLDFFTQDPNPPSQEEVAKEQQRRRDYTAIFGSYDERIDRILDEEWEKKQEAFRQFEPNGPMPRPFYDALLAKFKAQAMAAEAEAGPMQDSDIIEEDVVTAVSSPALTEITRGKVRRGLCDVKIDGVSQSHEYRAWSNLNSPQYVEQMRQLGLTIDPRWESFRTFLSEVGFKPHFTARLARIDKSKGWFQDNVEWRVNGTPVAGLERRPRGWPLSQHRVSLAKHLHSSCKGAVRELLKPQKK